MKVLWIGRIVPAASTSGDRVYSRGLITALAHAGAEVVVLGLADPEATSADVEALDGAVRWLTVPTPPASVIPSLFSLQPLVTRRHATAPIRRRLQRLLGEERFDAVVFDNYAAGWALSATRRAHGGPVRAYVAHNHEASLAWAILKDSRTSWPRRLALRLNAAKIGWLERRLVARCDLVSAITQEDADAFARQIVGTHVVLAPPGHPGAERRAVRALTSETPRRVVLLGSYRWEAKQMNLRALVQAADARFSQAGVVLDVVGEIPVELRSELQRQTRSTVFHGFVADPSSLFEGARVGLVPEVTGGGFKLKTLDYVFAGLPVVALDNALAGLPPPVRHAMVGAPDLTGLVDAVLTLIDDLPELDRRQRAAREAAAPRFGWAQRGTELHKAFGEAEARRGRAP